LFTHELAEHRDYLDDARRLDAYQRALTEVVTASTRVLDLGAGTGILGLLACEAGAERVYAVDGGAMLDVARAVADLGPYRARIRHVPGWSTQLALPEPVDLIVADQMDPFAVLAGLLDAFADAKRRHLRPGGRTMPSRIRLFLAPVEHPAAHEGIDFWASLPAGFDFAPVRTMAVNNRAWVDLQATSLLADAAMVATIDPAEVDGDVLTLTATFTAGRTGTLHGWGGWFSAQLSPSVAISNSPADPVRIRRQQQLLPLDAPVAIEAGDELEVKVVVEPRAQELAWTTVVAPRGRGAPKTFQQSTFLGRPMSLASLKIRRGDHCPVRSPWGEVRSEILSMCDGNHSIAQIEAHVFERHRGLFPLPQLASAFVRDAIAQGAR
jgi:protein arginine N-methyltransferase 1